MAASGSWTDGAHAKAFLQAWRQGVMLLAVLGFLWFRLLDHLRVEWSVNPQYAYGWAVPLLCLYLFWKRVNQDANDRWSMAKAGDPRACFGAESSKDFLYGCVLGLCALAYAPTRLIQEANPEWRLVGWVLALEVIGITLALVSFVTAPSSASCSLRSSALVFPLCFFLVAVPWPTLVEGPLIQGLTRANSSATVEMLGVLGVPAVQQGNTIEVGTGVVGIDEACSGIRSFQATLMIALFFGELYRLPVLRRIGLCLSGFAFSFLFNVARTTLLTFVAARRGTAAIHQWHDPAGVAILVGCFGALWLLGLGLARGERRAEARIEGRKMEGKRAEEDRGIRGIRGREGSGEERLGAQDPALKTSRLPSSIAHPPSSWIAALPGWVLLWVMVVEVGTAAWYRLHERHLPPPTTWTVALPHEKAGFREVPVSENTRRLLRQDEAQAAAWQEGAERRFQVFFFRWNPGRVAAYLARSHTPAVCLTACGHELMNPAEPRSFAIHGHQLPFWSYVFKDAGTPLRVYYCLWEDRALGHSFGPTTLTYRTRFAPVLAGYRNSGQRSLELAIWGIADDQEADAEAQRQLEQLIRF